MIYTGYFARLPDYKKEGLTPVDIGGYSPPGYTGLRFRELAPKKVWWQEWHDKHLSHNWYEERYRETVLNLLEPVETARRIQSLGKDIVLLCREEPPQFCHRHLAAKWFCQNGIPVREYE